jgi:hypothetical protein
MPLSPRTLRPANNFTPRSISGLALWLDASDASSLYTTDAGAVTAVSSPTEIAGCVGWWDASDAASITASGGSVSQINDKSGLAAHASQGTSGSRPTLIDNALNGRSILRFDGGDGLTGNFASSINTGAYSVFAVCKATSVVTNGRVFSVAGASNDFASGMIIPCCTNATTVSQLSAYDGASGANKGAVDGFTSYAVFSGVVGTSSLTNAANGMRAASASVTLNTAVTRFGIGAPAQGLGSGAGWNGDIAEVIYYSAALSTADRARVEAYLAQRWGIAGVHAPATATSDPVGYWADKSGNARHLTQATSASRPTFLPTGISSKPALNFDGTDDNIWRQPGLTSDDLSILLVHQTNTLSGGVTYEFSHSSDITNSQATNLSGFGNVAGMQVSAAGAANYMSDVVRSFTQIDLQGRSGTAGDITANVPYIGTQCVSYSANASAIRKQSWTSGKGMPNNTRFNCGGWSAVTLGARRNNQNAGGINIPTVFLNGRIAEVIAYSRYISDTDRRRLELYLARKWSVTLAGAPTVSNAEAQDWIDRVYGNGGSVSASTAAAVNTFCTDIDSAGIRDRFFRLNIFAGSNLNACLTPLYLGPTSRGIRYGNTTDTNNAFVGVGTDYAETGASGGLTGNGTTKYLATGLNPYDAGLSETDFHTSGYFRETQNTNGAFIGCVNSSAQRGVVFHPAYLTFGMYVRFGGLNNSGIENGTLSSRNGHLLGVRRPGGAGFKDGANINATSVTTGSLAWASSADSPSLYGFARNDVSASPSIAHFAGRSQAYSIGKGMTDAQAAAYYTAMQAFQTALGRNA